MRRHALPATIILLTAGVLVGAWLFVERHRPGAQEPPPPPVRAAFDGTQPLALRVKQAKSAETADLRAWLKDELDYVLPRATGLRFTTESAATDAFVLSVEVPVDAPRRIVLSLHAPDGFVERRQEITLAGEPSFGLSETLLTGVPHFLGLSQDWRATRGTNVAASYDALTRARATLRSHTVSDQVMRVVEQLERVTRAEPRYARAWSTLALLYLRVESEDAQSLATLAAKAADRATKLDPAAADAHAVRGLVHYRAGQWVTAHEELTRALSLAPESAAALEFLSCLLMDAGLSTQARALGARAVQANPSSVSARECAAFAEAAAGQKLHVPESDPFAVARLTGTLQWLAGEIDAGKRTMEEAARREGVSVSWLNATASAVRDPANIANALRALTYAASEQQIDPTTELLAGLALRRREFVVNRIQRLQRGNEFVPLRVVWLPQAIDVRRHSAFDDLMDAAELPAFWRAHGKPDVCASEPRLTICR